MTEPTPEDIGSMGRAFDELAKLAELATGLRESLKAQGWSHDNAEEVTLTILHSTMGPGRAT